MYLLVVRAVLRSRSIPFDITDHSSDEADEKNTASALRATLIERIREAEITDNWLDHGTVMKDAEKLLSSKHA
jgi:antitoxin component of RelBE/YafQ-DinJ toxin-antitoxin module